MKFDGQRYLKVREGRYTAIMTVVGEPYISGGGIYRGIANTVDTLTYEEGFQDMPYVFSVRRVSRHRPVMEVVGKGAEITEITEAEFRSILAELRSQVRTVPAPKPNGQEHYRVDQKSDPTRITYNRIDGYGHKYSTMDTYWMTYIGPAAGCVPLKRTMHFERPATVTLSPDRVIDGQWGIVPGKSTLTDTAYSPMV